MQEQDKSFAGLETDITRLHGVTVEISNEVNKQNKCVSIEFEFLFYVVSLANQRNVIVAFVSAFRMLDDLTDDVDEAQERMNFVMGRLSKLLKTKGCDESLYHVSLQYWLTLVFLLLVLYRQVPARTHSLPGGGACRDGLPGHIHITRSVLLSCVSESSDLRQYEACGIMS